MNNKEIFKKVGVIINELNEQYNYLSQSPDNLNELELELFSANANFLSDHLSILVKLNDNNHKEKHQEAIVQTPIDHEIETNHVENRTGISDEVHEETLPDWKFGLGKEPDLKFEFEEKQTDKLFDRPLTEEERKVIDEKTRLKTVFEKGEEDYIDFEEENSDQIEEVQLNNFEEKEENVHIKEVIISERTIAVPLAPVQEEKTVPTVNDLLSKNIVPQTIASQFNSHQNKDLKSMISLNDKLLFVRDLFNGYSLAYSEALELLNRFDNFEAADNFLKQNYSSKNNWSVKQDVADKFYEVLNRRFSK